MKLVLDLAFFGTGRRPSIDAAVTNKLRKSID